MSKDQKSMGLEERDPHGAVRVRPALPLPCITRVFLQPLKLLLFNPPQRCNSSTRKPSDNVWRSAKNSPLLKGYLQRFIELLQWWEAEELSQEKETLMCRFVFHFLMSAWWGVAGSDQWESKGKKKFKPKEKMSSLLEIESKHFLILCVAHIKYIKFYMFVLKYIEMFLAFFQLSFSFYNS